jgi:serine/threonine protein kinase/formylglycine-generating enzyme required for sulfatase activity/dienelactone hydrolase
MEGRLLSHYKVLEKLGGGGMGVVYRGLDLRLDRHVALKFLPPELSRDSDARERLTQEAKAASALDHPNLCTIHDIDATPEGQLFIAMAYYDGETLKKRIARGPLSTVEALDVAIQMAQGLVEAHAAGIVHRDIKPANVMLTKNGLIKIVDFGIAKLLGATGPTQAGTALGTVAYMSPEQVMCEGLDQQSDVWSLGAVLYELLTAKPAFDGSSEWAVMNAIRVQEPKVPSSLRPEIPPSVDRLVARALAKDKAARFESATAFLDAAKHCRAELMAPVTGAPGRHGALALASRWRVVVPLALAALIVVTTLGVWLSNRDDGTRWARDEALPEIKRLLDADQYSPAFVLAGRVEQIIPNDPTLVALWPQISRTMSFTTTPEGAAVSYAPYSPASVPTWITVGRSPLAAVKVPQGPLHLRIEASGFETAELLLGAPAPTLNIALDAAGTIPSRMVRIPAGELRLGMAAFDDFPPQHAPAYGIDKYEVTNREFKAFIDAGGYRERQYWEHAFEKESRAVSFEDAMTEFRDQTGRPGPSTWEGGTYPQGQDDYPVSGVSWYEAAAYARFRQRSLPTVYHWLGGTVTNQAAYVLPLSNIGGRGMMRVGSFPPGPRGTYDMAGNVKEWCLNRLGTDRFILGGAWNEASHLFFEHDARDPFSRLPGYGFRTVDYFDATPTQLAPLMRAIERVPRNYAAETPASNEVFSAYLAQFAYDPMPLNASAVTVDESSQYWRKETVTFDAAYGGERITTDLFLPKNVQPPFQTIVFFPGSGTIQQPSSKDRAIPIDYVIKSGRAVMYPVYKDTFERRTGLQFTDPTTSRSYVEHVVWWVKDVKRSLDYLETRSDIAREKLAFYGLSWGGRIGNIVLAVEPRIHVAVLAPGGFPLMQSLPEVKEINFAPRITIPVLMVNGRHDRVFPVETSQKPMFSLLGTPADQKKHVVYEAGHGLVEARSQMAAEVLAWLDKYLGPVQ